jgi:hypothetical protein
MMQSCLGSQIGRNIQVYIDDVVITTREEKSLISDLAWNKELSQAEKMGLLKNMPAESLAAGPEIVPRPPLGFRVIFIAFLLRGLSFPPHSFLRGLLFAYGIQLHDLNPNSIVHIACFITLCECFLGIEPHWALWR